VLYDEIHMTPTIRRPDDHTARQRLLSVVLDIELDALEPEQHRHTTRRDILDVMLEEQQRGARRLVL
jgi:hypothetical protein